MAYSIIILLIDQYDFLACQPNTILNSLTISTSESANKDEFSIVLLSQCKINPFFASKNITSCPTCEFHRTAYEGEDNIRRPLLFSLNQSDTSGDSLTIEEIILKYPHNVAKSIVTNKHFTLYPGEQYELFIEYECLHKDPNILVPANWYKLQVEIYTSEYKESPLKFEYWKICKATYANSFDVSHFALSCIMFLIIYLSFVHRFNSHIEKMVVTRFHELKDQKNFTIIFLLLSIVLFTFSMLNIILQWLELCLMIVIPLSMAMIFQSSHREYKFLSWIRPLAKEDMIDIPLIGKLQKDFIISLIIAIILTVVWYLSYQWLLGNFIAICISISIIRLFKFTSIKFLMSMNTLIFVYDLFWVINQSNDYTENFKLTNTIRRFFPIRILCPELVSSPFNSCNALPISDVVLPGFLLSYLKHFDQKKKEYNEDDLNSYFTFGMLSIIFGLLWNLFVFYFLYRPTPTFLYTGPCIIITALGYAFYNNELPLFLNDFHSTDYLFEFPLKSLGEEEKVFNDTPVANQINGNGSSIPVPITSYQSYEMSTITCANTRLKCPQCI